MSDVVIVVARADGDEEPSPPAEDHWSALVPPAATEARPWAVQVLSLSGSPGPGHRREPKPLWGWDLAPALAGASVVHVCRPYTSAGEVAVLAARAMGKRLVASDLTPATSELGRSLDMLRLVHTIVCRSQSEAAAYRGQATVEVVDPGTEGWLHEIDAIHGRLLDSESRS